MLFPRMISFQKYTINHSRINSIEKKENTYTHKSNGGSKGYIIDSTLGPWQRGLFTHNQGRKYVN